MWVAAEMGACWDIGAAAVTEDIWRVKQKWASIRVCPLPPLYPPLLIRCLLPVGPPINQPFVIISLHIPHTNLAWSEMRGGGGADWGRGTTTTFPFARDTWNLAPAPPAREITSCNCSAPGSIL